MGGPEAMVRLARVRLARVRLLADEECSVRDVCDSLALEVSLLDIGRNGRRSPAHVLHNRKTLVRWGSGVGARLGEGP